MTDNEFRNKLDLLTNEVNKLKIAVYRDELTEVYNRSWFIDNIGEHINHGLAMVNVDNFKYVVDNRGYKQGDELIINIAKLLQNYGKVVRVANNEFLVIFSSDSNSYSLSRLSNRDFCMGVSYAIETKNTKDSIKIASERLDRDMVIRGVKK